MFCSEHPKLKGCYTAFSKFTVARGNSSICKEPLGAIVETTRCPFLLLKKLIIRLRRGRIPGDWEAFRDLFESEHSVFISTLNARWLVSILDTYADYADPIKRRNALLCVSIVSYEKFVQTLKLKHPNTGNADIDGKKRVVFASGLDTVAFAEPNADMAFNFFKRMRNVLVGTPVIYSVFKKIVKEMLNNETTFKQMVDVSDPTVFKRPLYRFILEEEPPCRKK